MPRFDYVRARQDGASPEEIVGFLDSERAKGREYDVDPRAFPELRTARARIMSSQEPGLGQEDPIGLAIDVGMGAGPTIRGGKMLAGGAGQLLGRLRPSQQAIETGAELVGGRGAGMLAKAGRFFGRGAPGPQLPPGATSVPAPQGWSQAVSTAEQALGPRMGQEMAQEAAPAIQAAAQPLAERGGTSIARMSSEELAAFRAANPGKTIVQPHVRELPKPKPRPKPKLVEQHPNVSKRIAESNKAVSKKKPEMPESWKTKPKAESRHDVQYYSESKGTHVNIEDMNQKHLEQAYRKLASTNPKPGSVAQKVLDAMLEEAKHRYKAGGIHIGQ